MQNNQKTSSLGFASKVVGIPALLGALGVGAFLANQHLSVNRDFKEWKTYEASHRCGEEETQKSEKEVLRMINETTRLAEEGKLPARKRTDYLSPNTYTEMMIPSLQNLTANSYNLLPTVFGVMKEVQARDPLEKSDDPIKKARKDIESLMKDETLKSMLVMKEGKFDSHSANAIGLGALIYRLEEDVAHRASNHHRLSVVNGIYFDNQGWTRERLVHQWLQVDGQIIDPTMGEAKTIPANYIPLEGVQIDFKTEFFPTYRIGNTQKSVLYVRPNKN